MCLMNIHWWLVVICDIKRASSFVPCSCCRCTATLNIGVRIKSFIAYICIYTYILLYYIIKRVLLELVEAVKEYCACKKKKLLNRP